MDVTLMLNNSLALLSDQANGSISVSGGGGSGSSFAQSPTPSSSASTAGDSGGSGTTASSPDVSTPSEKSASPVFSPSSPRRQSDSVRTPVRSSHGRTPWNAGGYSLPLVVAALDMAKIMDSDDAAAAAVGRTAAAAVETVAKTAPYYVPGSDSSPLEVAGGVIHSTGQASGGAMGIITGGFSISLDQRKLQHQQHNHHPSSSSGSPKSPRHKFSDSRSSLSSYTTTLSSSSNNSISHSRISSLSTVSGIQPLSSIITDIPMDALMADGLESASSNKTPLPPKMNASDARGDASPTAAPPHAKGRGHSYSQSNSPRDMARPASPSDAILITRGGLNGERQSPSDQNSQFSAFRLAAPDSMSKSHKRAVSAPDIPRIGAMDSNPPPFGTIFEPTPPASQPGDGSSPSSMDPPGASPATADAPAVDEVIRCMYIDNCDTGSQMRKAISHIFGRNKMCTRLIPPVVWVHFCRKHYQRSRYRNAQEYAKLQCELVQKQIQRVEEWSQANKAAGRSGVVTEWSLTVRKREQRRIDSSNSGSRKRPHHEPDSEDEDFGGDGNGTGSNNSNTNAVPVWLLEKCGFTYQTAEIEAIVAELRVDMDANNMSQIPDIEILPSITQDPADESAKPKTYHKRKNSGVNGAAAAGAHKRSQSMGMTALRPDGGAGHGVGMHAAMGVHYGGHAQYGREPYYNTGRRTSQPTNAYWPGEESPEQKRQRLGGVDDQATFYHTDRTGMQPGFGHHPGAGLSDQQRPNVPGMRRIHLPYRSAFGHIRETQGEDGYGDEQQHQQRDEDDGRYGHHYHHHQPPPHYGGHHHAHAPSHHQPPHNGNGYFSSPPPRSYSYSGPANQAAGPLPAPTAQRYGSTGGPGGLSMAARLESSSAGLRRPPHQRSQSEVHGPSGYGYGYESSHPPPRLDNPFATAPSSNSTTPAPPQPQPSAAYYEASGPSSAAPSHGRSYSQQSAPPPNPFNGPSLHAATASSSASPFASSSYAPRAGSHVRHQSSPSVPRMHHPYGHHHGASAASTTGMHSRNVPSIGSVTGFPPANSPLPGFASAARPQLPALLVPPAEDRASSTNSNSVAAAAGPPPPSLPPISDHYAAGPPPQPHHLANPFERQQQPSSSSSAAAASSYHGHHHHHSSSSSFSGILGGGGGGVGHSHSAAHSRRQSYASISGAAGQPPPARVVEEEGSEEERGGVKGE